MSMILILQSVSPGAANPADGCTWDVSVATRPAGMNSLSLEKSWHGLHFLLTGEPWGGSGYRAFLMCGGTEQGEDLGYGPARVFDPDEVVQIHQMLDGISSAELWSRFDPEQMANADLYGADWQDESEEDLREEFTEYFERLKQFITQTARDGKVLRIEMT